MIMTVFCECSVMQCIYVYFFSHAFPGLDISSGFMSTQRHDKLSKKAIAAAKKIGKVEVDHGDTGCKTPDAESYIVKTLAYNKKKSAKAKLAMKKKATKPKIKARKR